eukprot:g7569.t1
MRNTKLAAQVHAKNIMEQLEDATAADTNTKKRQEDMVNRYKVQEANKEGTEVAPEQDTNTRTGIKIKDDDDLISQADTHIGKKVPSNSHRRRSSLFEKIVRKKSKRYSIQLTEADHYIDRFTRAPHQHHVLGLLGHV